VFTIAAKHIPGFETLGETWAKSSPLNWNPKEAQPEVAGAVSFLLGPYSKQITGQTLYVDGGASIIGGELLPHEQ